MRAGGVGVGDSSSVSPIVSSDLHRHSLDVPRLPPVPACSSRDLSEAIHTKWESFPSGINLLRVTPQLIRHSCSASAARGGARRDFLILQSLPFRWPLWFQQNRSTIPTLHLILGQDFNLLRDLFSATFLDKVQIAPRSQDFNSQGKVRLASSN